MALFEYFPNNYVWNLSLSIAMASGAEIGEIMDMCKPLKEAAAAGTDAGTPVFLAEWVAMADKLVELAQEDSGRGRKPIAVSVPVWTSSKPWRWGRGPASSVARGRTRWARAAKPQSPRCSARCVPNSRWRWY